MRIRNGFVSNSSTSSFILSAKDDAGLKVRVTVEIDLADYRGEYSDDRGVIIYSPAQLERYIDDEYPDEDVRQEGWYLKAKSELEIGRIVLFGEIPYSEGGGVFGGFATLVHRVGMRDALADNPDVEVILFEGE